MRRGGGAFDAKDLRLVTLTHFRCFGCMRPRVFEAPVGNAGPCEHCGDLMGADPFTQKRGAS